MPPRHSKSEFASYLMPAWFLGRNPKLKIIQATHNTELAVRFGRKVRDLIDDPQYKDIFPTTNLKEDNKSAGKWQTDVGGEYFAAGVGAAVTGRGADLFVIDDPHSEQDALSESAFDHAYEWYTSGPRQRLQPGGSIIIVMTRWGKKDLTGRLIAAQGSDIMADQWEVVEFPAILPSDKALWPEFWDKQALLGIKASLPVGKWNAQWQQNPTSSESAIIKREWWQMWEKEKVPQCKYILQSYDTAFSKLRLRGIPALGFSPGKGKDKVTRMHMVAPLFEAGVVWAPSDKKFADDLIEEVVSFPNGDYDDFCDSMTLALMRFRQGGFVSLEGEEEDEFRYRRKREYY
jgi:predicted phage terminase large subunit-like protein